MTVSVWVVTRRLAILCAALCAGCTGGGITGAAQSAGAPGSLCRGTGETLNCSLIHDGLEREFILYRPESAGAKAPLLLNFHGYGGTAEGHFRYADFRAHADRDGFMIAAPQGTKLKGKTHWAVGSWTAASTVDDVGFASALIDAIADEYGVDARRVYSTGMSNGGYMSFHLACQLSDRIAAIASVTGSLSPEVHAACAPTRPVPVLQIHGTADGTVPFEGGNWTLSMADVVDYWRTANECESSPVTTPLADANGDGATPTVDRYGNCKAGVSVELYRVTDMGHIWPDRQRGDDIEGVDVVWDFLSGYRL